MRTLGETEIGVPGAAIDLGALSLWSEVSRYKYLVCCGLPMPSSSQRYEPRVAPEVWTESNGQGRGGRSEEQEGAGDGKFKEWLSQYRSRYPEAPAWNGSIEQHAAIHSTRTGWDDESDRSFFELLEEEVEIGEMKYKKYEKVLWEIERSEDHIRLACFNKCASAPTTTVTSGSTVTFNKYFDGNRNLHRLKRQLDEVEQKSRAIRNVTASCAFTPLDLVQRYVELGGNLFDFERNWTHFSPWHTHVLDAPLSWTGIDGMATGSMQHCQAVILGALARTRMRAYNKERASADVRDDTSIAAIPDLDEMPSVGIGSGLFHLPWDEWSIRHVCWLVLYASWAFPLWFLSQASADSRVVLLQPTFIMYLLMDGCKGAPLFLLHLRDTGRIRFDLGRASWLGPTAARVAPTDALTDALLCAQLVHDIADVSTDARDAGDSPRARLVKMCRAKGCTRELMGCALARGRKNPVLGAVMLAEAARRTHREKEATDTASDVITAALEGCPTDKAICALLWMSERGLSTEEEVRMSTENMRENLQSDLRVSQSTSLIAALCNSNMNELFANPLLQAVCKEALCPNGDHAPQLREISDPHMVQVIFFVIYVFIGGPCFALNALLTAAIPKARVCCERELFYTPGFLLPAMHGINLGFLLLCTTTALSIASDWARQQACLMTCGVVNVEEDGLQRGGKLDLMCVCGLVSSLIYEGFEWVFKGARYMSIDNLADVFGQGALLFAFVLRTRAPNDGEEQYADESLPLTVGLMMCWMGTLSRIIGEYANTGVLLAIAKKSFLNDFVTFLLVLLVLLISFGIGASSLYSKLQASCNDDGPCLLEGPAGDLSFGSFILAQFIWPLIGIDDVNLDGRLTVSAGDRPVYGPLFMTVFGVLCVVVMLNILIAMLSSTCACVLAHICHIYEHFSPVRHRRS